MPGIHALIAGGDRTAKGVCWARTPGTVAVYEDDAGIRMVLLDLVEMEGLDALVCNSVFELHQAAIAGGRVAIADSWGSGYEILGGAEREQIRALATLVPTTLISGRRSASK